MTRTEILQVAFIIEELSRKHKIKRYTYFNHNLIVFYEDNKREYFSIGNQS